MAEWLGTGLQNLLQRFDSAWYLHPASRSLWRLFLCPFSTSVMPDMIGHLLRGRGRELGLSGHEVAGAPDGVPPLSPTMSLTPSRTPHPSQLDPSPFAAPSPQLAPFASRTSRHAYSLLPAPSIVQPTPLPSPSPPRAPSFRACGICGLRPILWTGGRVFALFSILPSHFWGRRPHRV